MATSDPADRSLTVPAGRAGTVVLGGEIVVNRLGFGAMRVPGAWGEPNRPEADRILRRAVELGVNFVDTAHAYGRSEEVIGEALHPYPDGLVIATKAGYGRGRSGERIRDGRPETIRSHAERSLELLRLERVDLLQLHTIDPRVALEESIGAMVDLQREGKVRMIGVSNFSVQELERARAVADIASVQNRYSVLDRRSDDVLVVCERDGVAFLPWFPLGAGGSCGKANSRPRGRPTRPPPRRWRWPGCCIAPK